MSILSFFDASRPVPILVSVPRFFFLSKESEGESFGFLSSKPKMEPKVLQARDHWTEDSARSGRSQAHDGCAHRGTGEGRLERRKKKGKKKEKRKEKKRCARLDPLVVLD